MVRAGHSHCVLHCGKQRKQSNFRIVFESFRFSLCEELQPVCTPLARLLHSNFTAALWKAFNHSFPLTWQEVSSDTWPFLFHVESSFERPLSSPGGVSLTPSVYESWPYVTLAMALLLYAASPNIQPQSSFLYMPAVYFVSWIIKKETKK